MTTYHLLNKIRSTGVPTLEKNSNPDLKEIADNNDILQLIKPKFLKNMGYFQLLINIQREI